MNQPILFENRPIRKVQHNDEWYFVVNDVVEVLTESSNVRQYLKRLRSRDGGLAEVWSDITESVLVATEGGQQKMTAANRAGIFRIIQSIPSPKVETFKNWLAETGSERMAEEDDPQLIMERLRASLVKKGYDENWITARLRSVVVREQLTAEWQQRGIKGQEFAFLTDLIMQGTFDLTTREHKMLKGLVKENLRDHMSTLELVYVILSEETTKQLAQKENAQGYDQNREVATKAAKIAGESRKRFEQKTGLKVVSEKNFLGEKGKS